MVGVEEVFEGILCEGEMPRTLLGEEPPGRFRSGNFSEFARGVLLLLLLLLLVLVLIE